MQMLILNPHINPKSPEPFFLHIFHIKRVQLGFERLSNLPKGTQFSKQHNLGSTRQVALSQELNLWSKLPLLAGERFACSCLSQNQGREPSCPIASSPPI